MKRLRLAMRLYNTAHLITPEKLEVVERVLREYTEQDAPPTPATGAAVMREATPEPAATVMLAGSVAKRTQAGYYRTDDGMALVQVLGSLVQRSGWLDAESGLTSYQALDGMLSAAMEDPAVKGILLEIDSHGGEGSGLFELTSKIAAANKVKPVTAHANEQAFSAAYAIASSAGELVVAPTGMVGSIGVVMYHVDQSQLNAKRGLVYTPIFAGARKVDFSPHAPISDSALSGANEMVQRLYSTFVGQVASSRGVGEDVVRGTEAGLLHPDQAISLGLADSVGNIGQALESLRERVNTPAKPVKPSKQSSSRSAVADALTPKGNTMEPNTTTPATTVAPAASTQQPDPAAIIRAERERTQGILNHAEAAGRTGLAKHLAFATSMTLDEAVAMLAAAPKETGGALAASMAQIPNPKIGAEADQPDSPKVIHLDANKVYNRRRADVAKARRG